MARFGELHEKYGKNKILFPYQDCWFCTHIEDCPHPSVNFEGKAIPPGECVRRDEIILKKR